MENNNIDLADNAVATMRALPWLSTPSASRHAQAMVAGLAAAAPAQMHVRTVSMVGEGSYRLGGDPISGVRSIIKTDLVAGLAWATCVDHKFSTRLGPSASPPV